MSKLYTAVSDEDDNRWVEIDGQLHKLHQSREGGPYHFSDKDREPVAILPEPHDIEAWRIYAYQDHKDKERVHIERHRVAGWLAKVDPASGNVACSPISPSMDHRSSREVLAIVDVGKGSAWVWPADQSFGPCSDLLGVCNAVLKENSALSTIIITADDLPTFSQAEEPHASDPLPATRTATKARA